MQKKLLVEVKDGIGWVTLNHAERYNAIDYQMMDLLDSAIDELEQDGNVKVLVITGAGDKAFCSGGDLTAFHQLHTEKEAYSMLSRMGSVLYKLFTFPKPTVALLNGVAVGGGCEIASACDFRLAAPHVKFGFIQGTLGITTGWGGTTFLMERVAQDSALEWLLSAKKYSAAEGVEKGFIQKLLGYSETEKEFQEWIQPIKKQTPSVLKAYKQRRLNQIDLEKTKDLLDLEIRDCAKLWASDEHHQAVESFLKR